MLTPRPRVPARGFPARGVPSRHIAGLRAHRSVTDAPLPDHTRAPEKGVTHVSISRTTRSDAIARAVWLFTAPLLIPIVDAICASDRSA